MRKFAAFVVIIIQAFLMFWLFPSDPALMVAFGPLASLGIGAGVGLLGGLFGESEEEARNKKRRAAIERLNNMIKQNTLEGVERKSQADRQFGSSVVDRRRSINDELYEQGLDPGTSIASNERDLVTGNINEKTSIENSINSMNKNLQNEIGGISMEMEDEPGWLEKGLGGALTGGKLGMDVHSAVSNVLPSANLPKAGNMTTSNNMQANNFAMDPGTMDKYNNVLNPFLSGDKTSFSTGNLIDVEGGLGTEEDMASYYLKKYPFLKNKLSGILTR